jgi:hypothetical protein
MAGELEEVGGEELVSAVPLTPKELDWCERFANPESETYGKATASAEMAGYGQPHNAAWKLRRRPRIIEHLKQYEEVARVSVGKVLSNLEHDRALALAKDPPDVAAAIRADELMGKRLGMFVDVREVNVEVQREYTERERAEAQEIARWRLGMGGAAPAPVIDIPVSSLPMLPESTRHDGAGDARMAARDRSIEGSTEREDR